MFNIVSLLNIGAKNFFNIVYEYVETSYELLWRPKSFIRLICDNSCNRQIIPELYFTLNIILVQLVMYLSINMSNIGDYFITPLGGFFEIPYIGDVEGLLILNFIGYYIGVTVILLILKRLINNSSVLVNNLRNIVLYSSIVTLLIAIVKNFILLLVSYTSMFWIEKKVLDYLVEIDTANVLDNLDIIVESIYFMLGINMITEIVVITIYIFYLSNYLIAVIPYAEFKKFMCCGVVAMFYIVSCFILWYPVCDFHNELKKVQEHVQSIDEFNKRIEKLEDRKVDTLIELREHMLRMDDSYKYISESKILPEEEKLMVYEMYFILKYINSIPIEERTEDLCTVNYGTSITEANGRYVNCLLKLLTFTTEGQRLMSLQNKAISEKDDYRYRSSVEILLKKCKENRHKKYAFWIVPANLVKIVP